MHTEMEENETIEEGDLPARNCVGNVGRGRGRGRGRTVKWEKTAA